MKKYALILLTLLSLVGCSPKLAVFGRYVPERKDDFAWENAYAAFRMYGPALLPENPSNGIDLWLKASPELVVDSFYYREHHLGLPYHINYGKGLDCYKVGHTVGCGGLAIVAQDSLYVGGPYSRYEIVEQTPRKLVFRLYYDSVAVCGQVMQEQITITATATSPLCKAEVVLTNRTKIRLPQMYLGGGIYLHDTLDHVMYDSELNTLCYAEDALSDKTAARMNYEHNGSTSQGRNYVAVVVPGASQYKVLNGSAVLVAPYEMGTTFTYYFGAGWSKWHNGKQTLPTDRSWRALIEGTQMINGK